MEWAILLILGLALYILFIVSLGSKRKRGKNFYQVPGDPKAVMAQNPQGEMARVELPKGLTAEKVDAVFVGKKPEKAKVKVLHEKVNRRNSSGSTDHDMSL